MRGRVWLFGNNISTDAIIPGRFMDKVGVIPDDQWGEYCFVDHEPRFAREVKAGDFVIAGKNFGTGSSREVAPLAIKKAGIACIIAQSYARIFYRNCINLGLPAVTAGADLINLVNTYDYINVDLDKGIIKIEDTNAEIKITPLPPFAKDIIDSGGLLEYALKK